MSVAAEGIVVDSAPGEALFGRRLHRAVRVPVTYRGLQIPGDVLEYMVAEEAFTCPEAELPRHGFMRCVDMPHLAEHVYYEGYMHAAGVAGAPLLSMNPRTGAMQYKPPAPPRTAAFLEAFRRVNPSHFPASFLEMVRPPFFALPVAPPVRPSGPHLVHLALKSCINMSF
jgi:hypothetical protein